MIIIRHYDEVFKSNNNSLNMTIPKPPLPWREGIEGRGNRLSESSPPPGPSPVKGEGRFCELPFSMSIFRIR
jgi:hypothetical protein